VYNAPNTLFIMMLKRQFSLYNT